MPELKRKLKKVDVSFISLVDKGANQKVIIYKSDAHPEQPTHQKTISIAKVDDDQRMVYGIVYSPDEVDTHGDAATAEVIKEMSYSFMKNARTNKIDEQHDYNPDEGFVAESWLTKANDPVFPDEPEGSWAVGIKVENDDTWDKVKKGDLAGLSMAGEAVVEPVEKSEPTKEPGLKTVIKEVTAEIVKSIKETLHIKKDFNDEIENEVIRKKYQEHLWALSDANWKVMNDEEITDKKAALITNANQYIEALGNIEINKSQNNNNNEDIEMKTEEVKELIKTAVTEAVKPLNAKIDALEKSVNEKNEAVEKSGKEIVDRLEKVEKATPGSQQPDGEPNGEKVEKSAGGNIWMPKLS